MILIFDVHVDFLVLVNFTAQKDIIVLHLPEPENLNKLKKKNHFQLLV